MDAAVPTRTAVASLSVVAAATIAVVALMFAPDEPADHSEDVLPRSTQPR